MKSFFIFMLAVVSTAHALEVKHSKVILESFDDYAICQERDYSGSWCHEAMKDWVKKNPKDAFKAGKSIRLYMNHWLAVPFFEQALSLPDFDCKDPDLKLAVLGGLNLSKTGNEKVIDASEKIAFEKCAKEFKNAVHDAAVLDSNTFANVCKKLELKGLKKSKCDSL